MPFFRALGACCACLLLTAAALAADPPAEPRVTPGQVIVPPKMRRIWGELVKLDPLTRTGVFRNQSNDELVEFTVMPYAELLHHATSGDLQDFIPAERAIFRMHEDEDGKWRYLTYIQDEMNFFNNHKEWYYIDAIDREQGVLTCHQANFDQSYVREKEVIVNVDADTKFWRAGQPIKFADLKVGDRMQTKSRGMGRGQRRMVWHAFLDTESLEKFQAEQKLVHARRMREEGLPGYLDAISGDEIKVTLFQEARELSAGIKPAMTVRLAPAGVDRKPTTAPIDSTVVEAKMQGNLGKTTFKLSQPLASDIQPKSLVRVWLPVAK